VDLEKERMTMGAILKAGAICKFESHPGQLWKFTGKTNRHGCQMHGDDVKTYGLFLRRRNSDVRPWSNTSSEFELALAEIVEPN
jgi:hypothetical protein